MDWFDGTFDENEYEFNEKFPIKITHDIYSSEDGHHIAIINRFEKGSEKYVLADPHKEEEIFNRKPFYHVITGSEAKSARKAITKFIVQHPEESAKDFTLYSYNEKQFFSYGNGHLCRSLINEQEKLHDLLSDSLKKTECFIIPFEIYVHRCPVCGTRSLEYRGMYEICYECGWEDEGIDDPDEDPIWGPNGDYTIRQYREIYNDLKSKNPSYCWYNEMEIEDET